MHWLLLTIPTLWIVYQPDGTVIHIITHSVHCPELMYVLLLSARAPNVNKFIQICWITKRRKENIFELFFLAALHVETWIRRGFRGKACIKPHQKLSSIVLDLHCSDSLSVKLLPRKRIFWDYYRSTAFCFKFSVILCKTKTKKHGRG